MRIKAEHSDGFSELLLRWTLETTIDSDFANVTANWFGSKTPDGIEFEIPFDGTVLARNLAKLDALKENYRSSMTDSGTLWLEVEREGETRTWSLYGGKSLLASHPELEPFFEFWRPLDKSVRRELPFR